MKKVSNRSIEGTSTICASVEIEEEGGDIFAVIKVGRNQASEGSFRVGVAKSLVDEISVGVHHRRQAQLMRIRISVCYNSLNLQLLFNPGAHLIVRNGLHSESILASEIEGGRELSGAGCGRSVSGIPWNKKASLIEAFKQTVPVQAKNNRGAHSFTLRKWGTGIEIDCLRLSWRQCGK